MNSVIRNILAIILGFGGGSLINLGIVNIGHKVFPIEGVDVNDMDALIEVMPTLSNEYFIFPFFAHAIGTLVGATIAGLIAANHKMNFAMAIGVLFLLGGIAANYMFPGPTWFTVVDIVLAYIPMAWLGGKIALNFSKN